MQRRTFFVVAGYMMSLVLCGISYGDSSVPLVRSAIVTFEQRKPDLDLLYKAAEIGDAEAQFYLAETLRFLSGHVTSEAYSWYESSAEQGDMYSMYRLSITDQDVCAIIGNCPADSSSPRQWGETLLNTVLKKVEQGDGEAMEMMYTITGELDWLVRSAASGYPSAQNWLAVRYERGDGWFFWPGARSKEVQRLYKVSAEGGYPRAISQHAGLLLLKGDLEGAQQWLLKGVSIGFIPAVGTYASTLEDGRYYNFEPDLQLAYAMHLLLSDVGGGAGDISKLLVERLEPKLTSSQLSAAIQQAKLWKKSHPPVSYYPPKLERW